MGKKIAKYKWGTTLRSMGYSDSLNFKGLVKQ